MRRADAVVDVAPVGLVGDHADVRAEPPEDLRRDIEGRAVGTVEQHADAAQVELAKARVQLAQVVLGGAAQVAYAPDRGRARTGALGQRQLDPVLVLVGELVAIGGEELDAVVLVGVVRGRQHDGQVESVAAEQQRRGRRRQHAAQQRVASGRADARGDGSLEHLAGLARVAQDQHLRALGCRLRGRSASERERELCRQELAGQSTHTVRAEQLAGHTHPRVIDANAWRTEASCGPSSGRPSCAPSRASHA